MKKMEIIIRPSRLDAVKEALTAQGCKGMNVTEISGFGRQRGHMEIYRGAEYQIDLVPKIKVETVLEADGLQEVVDAVLDAARTGKVGDGKIFIHPVEEVVRIRTGERGVNGL
ncbi:MAG: P-II family nitrogen regulator [Desulfohalobiaceae bacterium]|nr:P-II family nitrogen regulator [Desulfohalobiaceae bacterium]